MPSKYECEICAFYHYYIQVRHYKLTCIAVKLEWPNFPKIALVNAVEDIFMISKWSHGIYAAE